MASTSKIIASDISAYLEKSSLALVAFPQDIDPGRLALTIIVKTRAPTQKSVIVTFNPVEVSTVLADHEIEDVSVVDYSHFLAHEKDYYKCLIIFDNLDLTVRMIEHSVISKILFKRNKVMILYSYDVNISLFTELSMLFPGAHMWKATLAHSTQVNTYSSHHVLMAPEQDRFYGEEYDKSLSVSTDFYETEKYCNILYPSAIRKSVEEASIPKMVDLIKEYSSVILNNALKIRELFTIMGLYQDQRQLIYTRYGNEYGIKLLEVLARSFGYNVYIIDKSMSLIDSQNVVDKINENTEEPCIVLTNDYIKSEVPKNISQLHYLDGNLDTLISNMNLIFKQSNRTKPITTTVHMYISHRANGNPSIETVNYRKIQETLDRQTKFWRAVNDRSLAMITGREGRLVIDV